jgi:peptidoglycan hydrolase-like protein with peptidoglycan-binding domain
MALQYGREDVRVYNLQQLLIDTGYLDRSRPTGYLGDETTAAICDFQLDKNVV